MSARSVVDRAFGLLARVFVYGMHRRVEMTGLATARRPGPRLLVVNHFNGLMDALVLVAALGRLPRFVAKATLHKVVIARPFLRLAGVVLVQRQVDGEGTAGNAEAFAAAIRRLRGGDVVAIFPEGTTHDRESLGPIRTGAARIALAARGEGVEHLRIVPVGLTFGDKTRLRNDVLVSGGAGIEVPRAGADDHGAVRALTDTIATALDALVPGVDDPLQAWAHERAAQVAARHGDDEPPLSVTREIARATVDASPAARATVEQRVAEYTLALDLAGVDDAAVAGTLRPRTVELVIRALVTWFALPMLATLAVLNAPAFGLVVLADQLVTVPVTKGTVRALVALVAFPVTWIIAAAVAVDGALAITGLVLLHPVALLVAVWFVEGDLDAVRRWFAAQRARNASARLPALRARRDAVVEAVTAARTGG